MRKSTRRKQYKRLREVMKETNEEEVRGGKMTRKKKWRENSERRSRREAKEKEEVVE